MTESAGLDGADGGWADIPHGVSGNDGWVIENELCILSRWSH